MTLFHMLSYLPPIIMSFLAYLYLGCPWGCSDKSGRLSHSKNLLRVCGSFWVDSPWIYGWKV